jgi:hypothetical protein
MLDPDLRDVLTDISSVVRSTADLLENPHLDAEQLDTLGRLLERVTNDVRKTQRVAMCRELVRKN